MAIVLLDGYRITDANGEPVSGGKLYVFEAGTSNPRDVYTEETLTTTHPNPVVSDAGGLLQHLSPIYTAEDDLKLRVTDASDVTIWEIDNYSTGGTGSGSGGDVTRTPLSKTANYTVQAADENSIIVMDASGIAGLQGDVTADSATLGAGFVIGVKNIGATGNTLIQGTGAQTIDGAANRTLTTQFEFIDLVSRGAAGWFVLASQGASDVSVTVRQADASSDGDLNFENELGTIRWTATHKQTSDDWQVDRYDSGGLIVDTPLRIDEATGDVETTSLLISASGRLNTIRATTSGTYNKPTALNYLGTVVKLRGSGGRGDDKNGSGTGRAGGGGGGGGYCEKWYSDADLSASEAYTILAANAGSGNSTFKSMSAGAGANAVDGSGGAGGSASGGDINVSGETGQGSTDAVSDPRIGGAGGGSYGHPGGAGGWAFGSGGSEIVQQAQDGYGPGTGGGGNGDLSNQTNGAAGEIIFIEYFS